MEWQKRRLYLLFTPSACRQAPWETLQQALLGGVELVQWRVKQADPAGLQRCIQLCQAHKVPVIVNDQVALAKESAAAGAHVGQDDMNIQQARSMLDAHQVLGVSTHNLQQMQVAIAAGADHLGFGPCFPSSTKGYRQGLTSANLQAALAKASVPTFAIGGINAANLPSLLDLGCQRIAVSQAILAASDPAAASAELSRMLPRL